MNQLSLITECGKPVAAIIPERLSAQQLHTVFALLPAKAVQQGDLATRWNQTYVFATGEWASEQRRRVPVSIPKQTVKLAFV